MWQPAYRLRVRSIPAQAFRAVLPLFLALGAVLGLAQTAHADTKPAGPSFVTVLNDNTPMKCLGGAPYYAVRKLTKGQVLRTDAHEGAWLRVEYVPGTPAYVKATEVTPDPDGKTVRLVRPSRLAAVNDSASDRGHWWPLLDQELPADSVLHVSSAVTGINGAVHGYIIAAPPHARGYVKTDSVRAATTHEAAVYQKAKAELAAAAAAAATPPGNPFAPITPVATAATPGSDSAAPKSPAPAIADAIVTIYDIETLKSRFESAMAPKAAAAEIVTVITDFNRKLATLENTPEDQRIRINLEQRLSALRLRRDILAALKRVEHVEVVTTGGSSSGNSTSE